MDVIVVIGARSIGQAIARRVSAKRVLLADLRLENADAAAKTLKDAGFTVTTSVVDVSSRASVHGLVKAAAKLGEIRGVIHAAGVSPTRLTKPGMRLPMLKPGVGRARSSSRLQIRTSALLSKAAFSLFRAFCFNFISPER
jgi:NAD(P)-dependent dehydrogenase (short-subunit alcohol dehydrogenase family)